MFAVTIGKEKYRVWFSHERDYVHTWGVGRTVCHIRLDGAETDSVQGETLLSRKDRNNFSREEGRKIAFTRALSVLERPVRKAFWIAYWDKLNADRERGWNAWLQETQSVLAAATRKV